MDTKRNSGTKSDKAKNGKGEKDSQRVQLRGIVATLDDASVEVVSMYDRLEANSAKIEQIARELVAHYFSDLDEYINLIDEAVYDSKLPPTDRQLEYYIMNLPILLYHASNGIEAIGIKEDTAKAIVKEKYNEQYYISGGTVDARRAEAELEVQLETVMQSVFSRAYRQSKQKLDAGNEVLNSMKKILTKRTLELEISRRVD